MQDKVELFPAESLATKMENMTIRLKRHKGLMKTIAVIAALVLSGWLYREFHPTIIFHTPQESKYLGKIVCTADGDLEKLYIENHTVRYRLPYLWSWKEEDEVAVFIDNYGDVIRKEDLDFWKLDIYLDEDNCYQSTVRQNTVGAYGISYNQRLINKLICMLNPSCP